MTNAGEMMDVEPDTVLLVIWKWSPRGSGEQLRRLKQLCQEALVRCILRYTNLCSKSVQTGVEQVRKVWMWHPCALINCWSSPYMMHLFYSKSPKRGLAPWRGAEYNTWDNWLNHDSKQAPQPSKINQNHCQSKGKTTAWVKNKNNKLFFFFKDISMDISCFISQKTNLQYILKNKGSHRGANFGSSKNLLANSS